MNQETKARSLALLGIILQGLHVLFGITAIIGILVAHTRLMSTQNTVYHSHIRWQIVTFWTAFAGYIAAFWLWLQHDQIWLLFAVALYVAYRLIVSLLHWQTAREIHRWL